MYLRFCGINGPVVPRLNMKRERERKRKSVSKSGVRSARKTKKRLRKMSRLGEKGVKIQKKWSQGSPLCVYARPHNQQHKREKYDIKTLSEKECARTV